MIEEAIILAGGLGTRLRSAVSDVPKCMAPVAGKPFLEFVMQHLLHQGVRKLIFSLGYKHEVITGYVNTHYPALDKSFAVEEEPLGTGGAIRLACNYTAGRQVLVVNGDTLFNININQLAQAHAHNNADCTLALKPMQDFNRYGVVELHNDCTIASFKEKQHYTEGLINGGIYALHVNAFVQEAFPQKFSFEKDYLEALYHQRKMCGDIQNEYFIDIGIPEDFERAQLELNTNNEN